MCSPMTLGEWAAVVDEKLVRIAPAFAGALSGKAATNPIGLPLPPGPGLGAALLERPRLRPGVGTIGSV
jgi:hypothetical protein